MLLFWLLWLSLVVGVVVGCLWAWRDLRLQRARVPAKGRAAVPPERISPVLDVQNERPLAGWQVRTRLRPRPPAPNGDDSPGSAAPPRDPGTD